MYSFQFTCPLTFLYMMAMNNRRNSHPRYEVGRPVSLLIGDNGCRVFCELKDMSLTGARLSSVPLRYMPQKFKILITGENVALPCKLRWIDGTEVGVQFTGNPDYNHNIYDRHQTTMSADTNPQL